MGGVRRVPRPSTETIYNPTPTPVGIRTANWTIEKTTTYVEITPAVGPVAWGGTLTDLDRELTATGSGYAALGALITWVEKPDSIAGVICKITPTYLTTEAPYLELWTLAGAVWTKQRRVAITPIARSGDTIAVDLTTPVLDAADVDAIWVTLAPSGTETLTFLILQTYGICNDDPTQPNCLPGKPPADCDNTECDVDPTSWLCVDVPGLPPDPTPDPLLLPPIIVPIAMPGSYLSYVGGLKTIIFHQCPAPTNLRMSFGTLPSGGSVTVAVLNAGALQFSATSGGAAITSQTISVAGDMFWWVVAGTGYNAYPAAALPLPNYLPPVEVVPTVTFTFTRQLDGTVWSVAGNLLDILVYFWTTSVEYNEFC